MNTFLRPQLEKLVLKTVRWNVITISIIIIIIIIVDDDTYYWVYLSSDHPFQVYYKVRQVLLQSTTIITKCDRTPLTRFECRRPHAI